MRRRGKAVDGKARNRLNLKTAVYEATERLEGNKGMTFKVKRSVAWVHPQGNPVANA